ncbi:hypothetical protein OOZ15_15505 [Galbibacter sp. EGI 63066]|uniref:hypothetical protein n=1 Tax=Galbibacter sp. EGI 63066 TaxID=2993559 RepID=UPI002248C6F5|nr:hypothetical protein [Galbibacter sp. EGI 63066]MCX2681359.1 hypothetical protein [Galbibacter sp. EGI 63066]
MKYFCLALITALAHSCAKSPDKAYFGGEIVNPNTERVYLYYDNELIDSTKLDANNRFIFELDQVKEGLYHFEHNEYQYLILEKGDSLLMRLNTLDFDESLVYSGRGSEKNNFLIDMYLIYEDEEKAVNRYSELPPEVFLHKIDSLKRMKTELLNDVDEHNILSPLAKHIVQGAINYRYFTDMEEYPFIHKWRNGLEDLPELPGNFYDYRKQIDYNDTLLIYYRPYHNYLDTHFNNMSYYYCKEEGDTIRNIQRSLHYNTHKLKLIDSIVDYRELQDNLTRHVAYSYLFGGHPSKENHDFIQSFRKLAPENQHQTEIDSFYQKVQTMQKGLTIPTLHMIDVEGKEVVFDTAFYDKNTVFYFWNAFQRNHHVNVLGRIAKLKEEFPEYRYIGININNSYDLWTKTLTRIKNDDLPNQYQANNPKTLLGDLVIRNTNKVIVVGINGKIIEGFGHIYFNRRLKNALSENEGLEK